MNSNHTNRHRLMERPLYLASLGADGMTALRRYRAERKLSAKQLADVLGVSIATLYRYEQGELFDISKANEIVRITRGKVRYRDLIGGFKLEYA